MAANGSEPPVKVAPIRSGRYASLRVSIGRRPADVVRMAVSAAVVLGALVASRTKDVDPVELAIFTELQQLPSWTARAWQVLSLVGWWPGIIVVAAASLYLLRLRLALSLTSAGTAAWMLALVIQWTGRPRPLSAAVVDSMLRGPGVDGFAFPDMHTAVVAALTTAGSPYVRRWIRHVGWLLVVLVAAGQVFLGHHLPLGVFGGAVLGWGSGTLSHLVFGAPGRKAAEAAVRMVLGHAGLQPDMIMPVRARWMRPLEFDVRTSDGQHLDLKIVRRMHRLAGPAYKLRRVIASLEVEHEPRLSTPRHEVEHEAYVSLLAERAGINTRPVLLAGEIEHGPPFLITRHVEGRPLSAMAAQAVDDTLLDSIWVSVQALGEAHIAHHDLRARKFLVDAQGRPRIVDFTFSRVGGPVGQRAQDIADTLVSLTSVVGVPRAVASAQRSVPTATLESALPYLQPLALQRRLRHQLADEREVLFDLRESLAESIGAAVPPFRAPVRPTTVVILLMVGLAIYLLLPQLSSLPQVLASMRHADRGWLAVAVATGLLGIVASAVSLLGSSPVRLPFWKTLAVQVAAAFTGRTTAAGVGFYGLNVVFLERLGLRRAHAIGLLILNRAVTAVVAAVATILGILVIGDAIPVDTRKIPMGLPVVAGAGALVLLLVAAVTSPWGRRRLVRPVVDTLSELSRDLLPTLRHPIRATQLFGGSIVFLALSAAGLAATLAAFSPSVPVVPVLAVYVVGSTLGQLVPTPGGLGTVEAALVAGLTAIGVRPTEAVAAVLTSRLLTFWLPVLPGLVAFRLLQHREVV